MNRPARSLAVAIPFLTGFVSGESQAAFPEKEITWIVPYSPGGGFDAWSRQIGATMKKSYPLVETPRLQAKKGLAKSTQVDEPGLVEMRSHGELLLFGRLQADNL